MSLEGEMSGTTVSLEKFGGDEFHLWATKMEMLLSAQNLWEIVVGNERRPTEGKDGELAKLQSDFDLRARRAFSTIGLHLKDNVLRLISIAKIKSASELWEKLHETYGKQSGASRLFMKRRFAKLRMESGERMMDFVTKVSAAVNEMAAANIEISDEDVILQLLMGLPSSYDALVVNLESLPREQLTREYVTSRLHNEEMKQRERESEPGSAAAALFAGRRPMGRSAPHGTPSSTVCWLCGQSGHISRDCQQRPRGKGVTRAGAHVATVATTPAKPQTAAAFKGTAKDDVAYLFMAGGNTTMSDGRQQWIIDSGATSHMCSDRDAFVAYERITPRDVVLGNGSTIDAVGVGKVQLCVRTDVGAHTITLCDVLHVPLLEKNLVSVARVTHSGLCANFIGTACSVVDRDNHTVLTATRTGDVYVVDCLSDTVSGGSHTPSTGAPTRQESAQPASSGPVASAPLATLWHQRLGHVSHAGVIDMTKLVTGMPSRAALQQHTPFCVACAQGKQHATPVPKVASTRATKRLHLVHSDVVGPMRAASTHGYLYYVCFVDDMSRKTWAVPMRTKDEVLEKFKQFKTLVEKQSGCQVHILRSDNGGEYVSAAMQQYLSECGIQHQRSAPYTPQQDGVAERCNRTVVEMARTMLHHARLDMQFWPDAVATAVHIKNRCSHSATPGKTPEELWTGQRADVSHLRVFGCSAYVLVPDGQRSKFDAKSQRCIMMGYQHDSGQLAYRLFNPQTRRYIASRDVLFDENTLGVAPGEHRAVPDTGIVLLDSPLDAEHGEVHVGNTTQSTTPTLSPPVSADVSHEGPDTEEAAAAPPPPVPELRRSTRTHRAPGEWWIATRPSEESATPAIADVSQSMSRGGSGSDVAECGGVAEHNIVHSIAFDKASSHTVQEERLRGVATEGCDSSSDTLTHCSVVGSVGGASGTHKHHVSTCSAVPLSSSVLCQQEECGRGGSEEGCDTSSDTARGVTTLSYNSGDYTTFTSGNSDDDFQCPMVTLQHPATQCQVGLRTSETGSRTADTMHNTGEVFGSDTVSLQHTSVADCTSGVRGVSAARGEERRGGDPREEVAYHTTDGSADDTDVVLGTEPRTLREALRRSDGAQWEAAVRDELSSLQRNRVYELVDLPPGRRAIGCKFVFKIKRAADGSVERYKARLVAKGFTQVEGVDFSETFAPVAKFNSIRTILAIAAARNLDVQQMDVTTAFLNGDLDEELYMQQPEGTVTPGTEHKVWRLRKALYGLKQSPRMWYQKLDALMGDLQFTRCEADHSVYVQATRGSVCIVAVYVDDLLIAGAPTQVSALKTALCSKFEMKDLGAVHWLLGIEVKRRTNCFELSQTQYVLDVLERFGMSDCRPLHAPLAMGERLSVCMCPQTEEERRHMRTVPYRSAVGSVMYAMVATRPDLAAAVGVVSRFMADPGERHWAAVKRILRYLRATATWCLHLGGTDTGDVHLEGYCDADWAGDPDERRSTTGYYFTLGRGCIVWSSKRQATVALSSTEAEYMAVSAAGREVCWIRRLLAEFGMACKAATVISNDNMGCIALAKNPVAHQRTKHIDVQHHFIRELVRTGTVILQHVPTDCMWADVLTKALPRDKHVACAQALGLHA